MHELRLEDRIALQDLIAAYSWALDTGDAEGLVACFTEDCVMSEDVFEDPDVWEGHEGIRGLMKHYAKPLKLRSWSRNPSRFCSTLAISF